MKAGARGAPPMPGVGQREAAVRRGTSFSLAVGAGLALLTAALVFGGCGGGEHVAAPLAPPEDASEFDDAEMPGALSVAPALLEATTYEGSGELVHPDAAVFPRRWQGRRYWLSATPYPMGNPKYENPSIYQGRTSREMMVPLGVTNPLMPQPAGGYLSDPDIVHDPDRDELRMYYRQTVGENDQLFLMTSRNGVEWSPSQPVLVGYRYTLISPSIVRESATSWRMWTVNAASQGCFSLRSEIALTHRRSADGITWSDPEFVQLRVPGRVPWHWDVQYVPAKQEYWALVAAYPEGTTCSHTAVFFARSADGMSWTVSPTPLLGPGEFEPIRDLVYRSTFHYHDGSDAVSVWFSGAKLDGKIFHYAVAAARYSYPDLARRVSGATPMILEREGSGVVSAELQGARQAFERDFP
jgi:hypothetical protein